MSRIPHTVVICAGGASRRMGRDKARIPVDGIPMLERIVAAVIGGGGESVVVGREQPADWSGPPTRFLRDDVSGLGPLGALATGLTHLPAPIILLPCDLPRFTPAAVEWLGELTLGGADACVASIGGRVQPLVGLYDAACLEVARQRLRAGRRSMMGLLDELSVQTCEVPGPLVTAYTDADTPGDLPSCDRRK